MLFTRTRVCCVRWPRVLVGRVQHHARRPRFQQRQHLLQMRDRRLHARLGLEHRHLHQPEPVVEVAERLVLRRHRHALERAAPGQDPAASCGRRGVTSGPVHRQRLPPRTGPAAGPGSGAGSRAERRARDREPRAARRGGVDRDAEPGRLREPADRGHARARIEDRAQTAAHHGDSARIALGPGQIDPDKVTGPIQLRINAC